MFFSFFLSYFNHWLDNSFFKLIWLKTVCASGRSTAKKIHAVLLEIKELLKRNRKREENIKVTWIGEDELGDDDEDDDDATNDVDASEVDLAAAATIKASASVSSSAPAASTVVAEEPDINEDNLGSGQIEQRLSECVH